MTQIANFNANRREDAIRKFGEVLQKYIFFCESIRANLRNVGMRIACPLSGPAFADDVILICPRASALDDLRFWQGALLRLGLHLALAKTAVWDPRGDADWAARLKLLLIQALSHVSAHGVTICGLPVAELSANDIDWTLAWGDDPFLAASLRAAQEHLGRRLQALMLPSKCCGSTCSRVSPTCFPLFPSASRSHGPVIWTKTCFTGLKDHHETLLRLPLRAEPTTWVLLTPPSCGGLGFTLLVGDVLLHCLSGLVALSSAGEHPMSYGPMTADEAHDADMAPNTLLGLTGVDALTTVRGSSPTPPCSPPSHCLRRPCCTYAAPQSVAYSSSA